MQAGVSIASPAAGLGGHGIPFLNGRPSGGGWIQLAECGDASIQTVDNCCRSAKDEAFRRQGHRNDWLSFKDIPLILSQ